MVPEHQSRSARLLNSFFPEAVRALNSTHPPLSETPYKPPTSWNMDHHPPTTSNLPHQRKNSDTFLCSSKCASHRWVGLHKPPVVTHSPLFALDTFHTLLCVHNPTKRVYVCLHAHALHIPLHCSPASCLTYRCFSLHMYSIHLKHSYSLYSLYFLFYVLVNIYVQYIYSQNMSVG